jgi:hypothetical protein
MLKDKIFALLIETWFTSPIFLGTGGFLYGLKKGCDSYIQNKKSGNMDYPIDLAMIPLAGIGCGSAGFVYGLTLPVSIPITAGAYIYIKTYTNEVVLQ